MSGTGTTLTIGGGYNGQSGILPVPSNFGTSIYNTLQSYLNGAAVSIGASGLNLINDDLGTDTVTQNNGSTQTFQTVTNYDTVAAAPGQFVTNAGAAGTVNVNSTTTNLAVEDPANVIVNGNASVSLAVFGAFSNVTYNDSVAQGSIYAAGGANTLNLTGQVSVYSAGNDSINLDGSNSVNDQVSVLAGASDKIFLSDAASATVSATGSAVIQFNQKAGGFVDLINGGQSSTVFSGAYGQGKFATNSVTVFGGAGGGIFVGGVGGQNSLTGGSGAVTLIGAGGGDTLTATANLSGNTFNELFTGGTQTAQTLLGAAGSSNNVFNIGAFDFGFGNVTAAGIASTDGANNIFDISNASGETLTGSTVAGATNQYVLFSDSTAAGAQFTITNFEAGTHSLVLFNGNQTGAGDATITGSQLTGFGANQGTTVFLSDNTQIFFKGLTSTVNGAGGGTTLGISSFVDSTAIGGNGSTVTFLT